MSSLLRTLKRKIEGKKYTKVNGLINSLDNVRMKKKHMATTDNTLLAQQIASLQNYVKNTITTAGAQQGQWIINPNAQSATWSPGLDTTSYTFPSRPPISDLAKEAKARGIKFNVSPLYLRFITNPHTVIINAHKGMLHNIFHLCVFERHIGAIVTSSESPIGLQEGIPDNFVFKCECDTEIDKASIIAGYAKYSVEQIKNV